MPNSAKAMARWLGWASSLRMAWATGCSPPPVRPWTARRQISTAGLGASPQASEAHTEAGNAGEQEPLAAQHGRQPAREGQHDRVGDQTGGQDPGRLVRPRRQIMGDVLQGDIGDRDVQHLLEGRHGDHGRHQPEARPVRRRSSGGPAHRAWSRRASASPSCACAVVMALRAAPCSASVDCAAARA